MGFKMKKTVVFLLLVYLKVEGWSCPSVDKVYSRVIGDVTLRFKVEVSTATSNDYKVYSYNTYLGSIVIYSGGVVPNPVAGISISGDVSGNINVTIPKVQVSSSRIYWIQAFEVIQCLFVYTLGKPKQPRIASNKDPTVGENVILTCSSTSTTVPSNHSLSMKYKWKINNADVPANSRYILSSTGANLTVVNVNKTDAQSRFTCTAQEDVSQAYMSANSNIFAIDVLYPPDSRPIIVNYSDGDTYSVIDKTTGTLPCTIKGGNPRPTLTWTCYDRAGSYSYPDNQTVTKTVTWTATRETDAKCTCRCPEAVSGQQSTYVNVKILYQPSRPSFSINSQTVSGAIIKVIRGKSFTVTCNSSSEPTPSSYTWKRPDGSSLDNHILAVSNVQTLHNGQYSCKVENTMSPSSGGPVTGSADRNIQLLVLFPPTRIELRYGNVNGQEITGNTVNVIVDDDVNIVCKSTAEPSPDFIWNYKGQISTETVLTFTSISSDKTGSGTCTATNTMVQTSVIGGQETGTATSTVSINVMYPPIKPSMKFNYQFGSQVDVSDSMNIVEGRNFTVTCNTASNPIASYSWSSSTTTTTPPNKELHITNVNRQQRGTYSCHVSNTMVRSFGATATGINNITLVLVILYPPEIGALTNKSIEEGSSLQLPCPYTAGSPAYTKFKWTRDRDQRVWNTQQLTISNVSRTDDMMYTCTIYNTMNPTNEIEVKGEGSGIFHLNILYKTSITSFFIQGNENKESVTIDETTIVDFTCRVTSNPESRISVLFHDNVIKSVTGSAMTHTTKAVTCLDTGIYKCTGQNVYNAGIPSVKKVTMYVQCRPSVYENTQENVTSAQNDNVTLNVRVLANPRPDTVTWQKLQGKRWISVEESDLLKTTALPLQINGTLLSVTQLSLTFLNVTQSNYGQYRMVANNQFSNVTQQFYLQAQDKPNPPTEFVYTGNHLSKVTVQWKPGFDGGLRQTFILRYKREKDVDWKRVDIADTGGEMMSYTIYDLAPGTSYQLMIYARNDIGNSSLSERLLVQTTEEVKPGTNAALIGGAVGGGLSFAVLLVVSVLLLRWFRNKKGKDSSEVELDDRRNASDEESSEDEVITENAMYQSAGDVKQGESNIYAKPQKKSNVVQGGDVYSVVKKLDKSGQKKKKVKKNKAIIPALGDIYENSADLKDDKTYTNSAYDDNPYENPLVKDQGKKPKRNVNKDGLIYADLTFNDQPKGQTKLVIHGLDSMTEYVEVDFTKKADPLPDSDEEEKSDARK